MKRLFLLLFCALACPVSYGQETALLDFSDDEPLKSGVSFSIGPAFPTASFGRKTMYSDYGENMLNGAELGFRTQLKFNHFFTRYIGLGFILGNEMFGFDPANLETFMKTKYSSEIDNFVLKSSSGWRSFYLGGSLDLQFKLVENLYLTSSICVNYQILQTPSVVLARPFSATDTLAREACFKKSNTGKIVLSSSIGVKYRTRKHICMFADLHFVNALFSIKPEFYIKDELVGVYDKRRDVLFSQAFSVFSLMVGVNYLF